MSDTKVINPTVTVSTPLGEASPANVTVSFSTGQFPTASFSAYSGPEAGSSAMKVTDANVARYLGLSQRESYGNRTSPDSSVGIDGGDGAPGLRFSGYLLGPELGVSPNSVTPMMSLTGRGAILEHLKLDIYKPSFSSEGEAAEDILSAGNKAPGVDVTDPNLAVRLRTLTRKIIAMWDAGNGAAQEEDEVTALLKANRDRLNRQGPLDEWYALLSNSVQYLQFGWMGSLKDNPEFNLDFNTTLLKMLLTRRGGFSSIINDLSAYFQLMWVPGEGGGVGSLRRVDEVVTSEPSRLVLSTKSLDQRSAGGFGLIPIRQVIMRGAPTTVYSTEQVATSPGIGTGPELLMGVFPEEAGGGDVLGIGPPPYLRDIVPWFTNNEPAAVGAEDFDTFTSSLSYMVKLGVKFRDEVIRGLITETCRSTYIDASLAGSTLAFAVPLDLSLHPGRRFEVTNSTGEALFTGYLSAVTHSLVRSEGSGDATTSLNFTHVTYPGFNLPGL